MTQNLISTPVSHKTQRQSYLDSSKYLDCPDASLVGALCHSLTSGSKVVCQLSEAQKGSCWATFTLFPADHEPKWEQKVFRTNDLALTFMQVQRCLSSSLKLAWKPTRNPHDGFFEPLALDESDNETPLLSGSHKVCNPAEFPLTISVYLQKTYTPPQPIK